jgi:hypothetical protein
LKYKYFLYLRKMPVIYIVFLVDWDKTKNDLNINNLRGGKGNTWPHKIKVKVGFPVVAFVGGVGLPTGTLLLLLLLLRGLRDQMRRWSGRRVIYHWWIRIMDLQGVIRYDDANMTLTLPQQFGAMALEVDERTVSQSEMEERELRTMVKSHELMDVMPRP